MDDEYYLLLNEWFLILIISDLWCFWLLMKHFIEYMNNDVN